MSWLGVGLPSSDLVNSLSSLSRGLPLFLCCTSLHVSCSLCVSFVSQNVLLFALRVQSRRTNLLSRSDATTARALYVAAEMRLLAIDTS
jgi:hypothetical protein